jgi:MFS transporter, FHS family, L-fucose permease
MTKDKSMFILADGKSAKTPFLLVTTLFLLWGFCNGMIDVMDKHFQTELHLSLAQSAWVQFAHYLGYFLMSLPAGWLATKLGYKGGIIAGLLMVAVGGFWFIPATQIATFWPFLLGVCIIASGLTFLETIANPYSTVLGHPDYAAARINLAQSCNGIGWIFGPIVGSMFFYSKNADGVNTGSQTIYIPYVAIAVVVVVLAIVFYYADLPDIKADDEAPGVHQAAVGPQSLWSKKHFVMSVPTQFFYVAAQAGIFSFFINYMTTQTPAIPDAWNAGMGNLAEQSGFMKNWLNGWFELNAAGVRTISDKGAANLASLGFILFLIGRFSGAALMKKAKAQSVLCVYASVNFLLCALVVCKIGWLSVAGVFLTYFFMSIMFPTIFALGIFGLGSRAKTASSFLVMAIMGGAVVPKVMGAVADHYDMSRSFLVPMICFAGVAFYGWNWSRLSKHRGAVTVASGGH